MWSITHRLVKPTASAMRATSASRSAKRPPSGPARERRQLEAEAQRAACALAAGGVRGAEQFGRDHLDRLGRVHAVEPLAGQLAGCARSRAASWAGQDPGGHGPGPAPVAGPAHLGRGVEQHGVAGHLVPAGQGEVGGPPLRVQAEGVDDGEQAPGEPAIDDEVEHREGVGAGPLVVPGHADQRPQGVRRHDLLGTEVRGGPGGLARSRRSDQHDQAVGGQAHGASLAHVLPAAAVYWGLPMPPLPL